VLNRINTNQLPSGLYYLRSVQGQKQKVKKFIIE
ncbi:MAG: T9SS type A sorting domain-containing protein, partial [Bacteroidales bacterium]|nr:T9SS type A sorting domain-containing protein [Bacteroidales bacterium]